MRTADRRLLPRQEPSISDLDSSQNIHASIDRLMTTVDLSIFQQRWYTVRRDELVWRNLDVYDLHYYISAPVLLENLNDYTCLIEKSNDEKFK